MGYDRKTARIKQPALARTKLSRAKTARHLGADGRVLKKRSAREREMDMFEARSRESQQSAAQQG